MHVKMCVQSSYVWHGDWTGLASSTVDANDLAICSRVVQVSLCPVVVAVVQMQGWCCFVIPGGQVQWAITEAWIWLRISFFLCEWLASLSGQMTNWPTRCPVMCGANYIMCSRKRRIAAESSCKLQWLNCRRFGGNVLLGLGWPIIIIIIATSENNKYTYFIIWTVVVTYWMAWPMNHHKSTPIIIIFARPNWINFTLLAELHSSTSPPPLVPFPNNGCTTRP